MFIKKLTSQVICNPDEPMVETSKGKLRGLIVEGTYIFRGIKYADAKRFHMPEPVEPWQGVKDAIIYGTVCPEIQTVVPHDNYTVPHVFYSQDENCQYLNIWTQNPDVNAKRPVMVWLHGGGFSTGSGIEHFAYDGENMSRTGDVVVVTLNHRLNVLGFLDLSEYGEQYKYSGNLGMADIVSALEWVRDNIGAFGGDPDNVTIFGQSGGGGKVATLLQIPAADGLFHKAIIQSGIIRSFPVTGVRSSNNDASLIIKKLGISPEKIELIETVPYYLLARACMELGDGAMMRFSPVDDGDYYLGDAFSKGICEHARTIPVIVGTVLGEFSNNFDVEISDGRKNEWSQEVKEKLIREKFGSSADAIMEAFKKAYPEKNLADVLYADNMFRTGALEYSNLRVKSGCTNTYNYIFSLESPLYNGTLPWHNAEIPYVFHNADYLEASYIPGITEWLQDIVCGAWTTFTRCGEPGCIGMPHWDRFTVDNQATMIFDEEIRVGYGHDAGLMKLLPAAGFNFGANSRRKAAKLFGGGPRV